MATGCGTEFCSTGWTVRGTFFPGVNETLRRVAGDTALDLEEWTPRLRQLCGRGRPSPFWF